MLRNIFVSLAAVLCTTVGVRAASLLVPGPLTNTTRFIGTPEGSAGTVNPLALTAISTKYQDWGSATGSHPAGAGVSQGGVTTGLNNTTGDDWNMIPGTAGTELTSMGFSIVDTNAPTTSGDGFTVIQGEIDFFRQSDNSFINGFLWQTDLTGIAGQPGLNGGQAVRIIFDTNNVWCTNTFTSVATVNGLDQNPNNIGQNIRNPVGPIGTSQDRIIFNGAVQNSPFGANPLGNLTFTVRTGLVPEPGCLALIGLAGLGMLSRRRA